MNPIRVLSVVALLSVALTGCGSQPKDEQVDATIAAIVTWALDDPFTEAQLACFKEQMMTWDEQLLDAASAFAIMGVSDVTTNEELFAAFRSLEATCNSPEIRFPSL